jgi:putative flavoprotein involved in K+ transport
MRFVVVALTVGCGDRIAPVASEIEEARRMTSTTQGERIDTVIIGGGQAGLAVGHHLARRGERLVILEASDRIGTSWRNRWEGLRLFTPARYDGLPGMAFPAPPDSLPTKDDVADYLEAYAARFDLPIRTGVRVDRITPATNDGGDGWIVEAGSRRIRASQVVLATGAFPRPKVPDFAAELDPAINQMHASEFRDASRLQPGPVLIVGASNTGAEIAASAAREHATILSGRDTGKMPVRPGSLGARIFDPPFWFFLSHIVKAGTPFERKARAAVLERGGPLERIWPDDLAAAGVARVFARTVGVRNGRPVLEDGRVVPVANVVWCTGYRPESFSWVEPSIVGPDGWPKHDRGVVTGAHGLYIIGLPFLYSGVSSLLGGVGRDAAHIADRIAARAESAASARAPSEPQSQGVALHRQ